MDTLRHGERAKGAINLRYRLEVLGRRMSPARRYYARMCTAEEGLGFYLRFKLKSGVGPNSLALLLVSGALEALTHHGVNIQGRCEKFSRSENYEGRQKRNIFTDPSSTLLKPALCAGHSQSN